MKESERFLTGLINQGVFEIDSQGCIWRLMVRGSRHTDYRPLSKRRRAESRNGAYFEIHVSHQGKKYRAKAHRLVWIHLHGDIDSDLTINHLNGDKIDNRPDNLELVSLKDNLLHAHEHGLISGASPGENHPLSILTEKDVLEILKLYQTGKFSQLKLGKRFGVSQSQIGRIVRGDRWSHVEREQKFSRYGSAKLLPGDVRAIKRKWSQGSTKSDLAQEFNISLTQVRRIVTGKAWKHID